MIAVAQPPLPAPMPAIVRQVCPWQALSNGGCFYERGLDGRSGPLVFVAPGMVLWLKEHELGHAYRAQRVSPGEEVAIERAARWGDWHEEGFADAYANCRMGVGAPRSRWEASAYGVLRSLRRVRDLCAMIARAFWR